MTLQPDSPQQLSKMLAEANSTGAPLPAVDLGLLRQILEYSPSDMTVTVESGLPLAELQQTIGAHRQWLPIDPPDPVQTTINDLLAWNLSGPRRFGFGTIREHLLGLTVVLADGRVIKNGGKVVKNVAGYDLCKLFVGHENTLGIIVAATFKLQPLPEAERVLRLPIRTAPEAEEQIGRLLQSPVAPVIVDLHNLEPGALAWLIIGLAGSAEAVQWQLEQLPAGMENVTLPLSYHSSFWRQGPAPQRRSVLPSLLVSALGTLTETKFIAHAGNGVIYFRGGAKVADSPVPIALMRQLKTLFDPKQILPTLPW